GLIASRAQMRVRVDEHRHHGFAGEVDARCAGGHGAAHLRDLRAAHDQRRIVEDAAVAHNDAGAFVGGDPLSACLTDETGKEAESDGCRQNSYFDSMHWSLPG